MFACLHGDAVEFATTKTVFSNIPDACIINLGPNFSFPENKVPLNENGELIWVDPEVEIRIENKNPLEILLDSITSE